MTGLILGGGVHLLLGLALALFPWSELPPGEDPNAGD